LPVVTGVLAAKLFQPSGRVARFRFCKPAIACQAPLAFLMAHGGFRDQPLGALRLGIAHGGYCLGCCFALMALLFVGGIMNVLWIAGLTILVLLEKIVPAGRLIPRISGALIGGAGIWLLLQGG